MLDTTSGYTQENNLASKGRITLMANRTYSIEGYINAYLGDATYMGFSIFNADTGEQIGLRGSTYIATSLDTNIHVPCLPSTISGFTPSVDTRIELRVTGLDGTHSSFFAGDLNHGETRISIKSWS